MRPKKTKVEVNSNDSLTSLLQETYNDACKQINQAQDIMNEVGSTHKTETIKTMLFFLNETEPVFCFRFYSTSG